MGLSKRDRNRLMEISQEKIDLQKKKDRLYDARREPDYKISVIKSKALVEVSQIEGDNGKRLYTTEKMRDAAVKVKLAEDSEYRELNEVIHDLYSKISAVQYDLQALEEERLIILFGAGIDPYGNLPDRW